MQGTQIDCGKRIIDPLIDRNVTLPNHDQNLTIGRKRILGDKSIVTL